MSVPLNGVRTSGLKSCFSHGRNVKEGLYVWVTQTNYNRASWIEWRIFC
jgi:hypothetical protein